MISIIIPVYNKGSVIFKSLTSLINNLSHSQYHDYEIILVNDGSTDNSLTEAIRFKKFNGETDKIKIFYYTKNIGKGFALRYGFYHSQGDPVIFFDGDKDINTKYVINAIRTYHQTPLDMVIASKYHPHSRFYYPWYRYVYSFMLKNINRLLFNLVVSDTQVGLKVFRRSVLTKILPKLVIKRFATDLEMLVVAKMYEFNRIAEIPVVIKFPHFPSSSISLTSVKNFCQDIAAIYYRKNIIHYYNNHHLGSRLKNVSPSIHIQTA